MMELKASQIICIGEIVWDMLPDGRYLGGAPLNVAVNLHRLGVPVHMISAVGTDGLGDEAVRLLGDMNIPISGIQRNELPTGVVEVSLDDNGLPDYEIKYPSAWDAIDLSSRVQGSPWQEQGSFNPKELPKYLVVGTLVFRSELSRSSLFNVIEHRDSSTSLVLDVNLRKDGYTPSLVSDLMYMADVLKVNEEELELILEWMGDEASGSSVFEKMSPFQPSHNQSQLKSILNHIGGGFGLKAILLTLGARGAVLWRTGTELLTVKAIPVDVVDTVGAGDAFLAGVLYGWVNDWEDAEALAFGSKMGAYVAGHRSATPDLKLDLF